MWKNNRFPRKMIYKWFCYKWLVLTTSGQIHINHHEVLWNHHAALWDAIDSHKISPIPRKSLEISKTPIPLQGFDIHRDLQLLHQHESHPPRLPANLTWQRHRQNSVRSKCGKAKAVNLPFGDGFRQPNQPIKIMILGIDSVFFSTVISEISFKTQGVLKFRKIRRHLFQGSTRPPNRC